MSINRWMDKPIMVYPFNGILFNNKKEQITGICNDMDDSQKDYAKLRKPDSKGYVLYNSIYMTFQKRQIYSKRNQMSGCRRLDIEEGIQQHQCCSVNV